MCVFINPVFHFVAISGRLHCVWSYKLQYIFLFSCITKRYHCPYIQGKFIRLSVISDLCGTVAGMVTSKGNMSTEGETLPSFCPTLRVLDMSTPREAADVNFWQIPRNRKFFLFPVHAMFRHDCPLAVKPSSTPWRLLYKIKNKMERFSAYCYASFCCVCLGCCAANFGISGGTYELPCICLFTNNSTVTTQTIWFARSIVERE